MIAWVGREILPHERELRSWLRLRLSTSADVEDVVQECYCRLAQVRDVTHITQPRAYLFTMARNIVCQQWKKARVVRLEAFADMSSDYVSDEPSPERVVAARQMLDKVHAVLALLPERARRIFIMRRVDGMPQKRIAELLGVSENIVENDASRSLRAIIAALTMPDSAGSEAGHGAGLDLYARSR